MIFLDTEFNGFHGQLISMALVSDKNDEFYEVLELPKKVELWVAKNVIPILMKKPINALTFRAKLWSYMAKHVDETVIADWPEDIAHLMWWMCASNGEAPNITFNTSYIQSGKLEPIYPHNALSDAKALKDWYLNK